VLEWRGWNTGPGSGSGAANSMINIRIASDPRLLVVVRDVVARFCELVECSEEDQRRIVLAVDEACSNIIRHTYLGDTCRTIDVSCAGDPDRIEIILRDCGPPVDLKRVQPRPLDEVRPGGLGTHFIRSIMDEVEYGYEEGCGNYLRMAKHPCRSKT
jgi:anti-sigma regulatory factor (Ser/Thr protein kinase)